MARPKANSVTKSQSIRDYLTANPTSSAKEVVEALAKTGIKTNEGLVYAVKGGMKEKKRRKKRVAKAALAATASSNGQPSKPDAITMIRAVKDLAEKAGGYAKLMELVAALAE
jgi:predicted transcriptional regulator